MSDGVLAQMSKRMWLGIKIAVLFAIGATVGSLLSVIAGLAFVEFGRHSCTGSLCADQMVRGFIPIGSVVGGAYGVLLAFRDRNRWPAPVCVDAFVAVRI
jgi:hypothetical protein